MAGETNEAAERKKMEEPGVPESQQKGPQTEGRPEDMTDKIEGAEAQPRSQGADQSSDQGQSGQSTGPGPTAETGGEHGGKVLDEDESDQLEEEIDAEEEEGDIIEKRKKAA